jgi:SagB-type dehydrogenase family enzyme
MTARTTDTVSVRLMPDPESPGQAANAHRVAATVPGLSSEVAEFLLRAMCEFATIDDLEGLVREGDPNRLVTLHLLLHALSRAGLLELASTPEQPVVTLAPMTTEFILALPAIEDSHLYRLSRFAYLRRDGDQVILETPRAVSRVNLHGPDAMAILAGIKTGTTVDAMVRMRQPQPGERRAELRAVIALLQLAGVVERGDADGTLPEDRDSTLRQWEFHDLLFHARTRFGRHNYPMGGLYRFKGDIEPQPALKPNRWRIQGIPLPRPGEDGRPVLDPPLSIVMESRQSIRQHGAAPITVGQLGEFLYRVARVRTIYHTEFGELTNRPYPNGGASYELEIYLTIERCAGLRPGFYYYDPAEHLLCLITEPNEDTDMLVREACQSSGMLTRPQIVITLASRFQRVSWKYSGIAYATQLKNTGALYSMMYLVATAMGLAPCGLGLGNSTRFCRLAKTSWYEESSIGEFMLGSQNLANPQ